VALNRFQGKLISDRWRSGALLSKAEKIVAKSVIEEWRSGDESLNQAENTIAFYLDFTFD
jgi:hypothetical protein